MLADSVAAAGVTVLHVRHEQRRGMRLEADVAEPTVGRRRRDLRGAQFLLPDWEAFRPSTRRVHARPGESCEVVPVMEPSSRSAARADPHIWLARALLLPLHPAR